MIINIISLIISIIAIVVSAIFAYKQIKMDKEEYMTRNKIELYLYADAVKRYDLNNGEETICPAIIIRNVSRSVVYLEKYIFNGREYILNNVVLPSAESTEAMHYIYLPTDLSTHVSFNIYFKDWNNTNWQTDGYADLINREWKLSYNPCVRC